MQRSTSRSNEILVVDDTPANRHMLRKILEAAGYHTTEAGDGTEAIAFLAQHSLPDLIIMDLEMPRMNGLDAIKEIRKRLTTPILAATGNPDQETEQTVRQAGANAYLTKPFDMEDLIRAITLLLHERAEKTAGKSGEI